MILDHQKSCPPLQPTSIERGEVEVVRSYKYFELQLDNKLNWLANKD